MCGDSAKRRARGIGRLTEGADDPQLPSAMGNLRRYEISSYRSGKRTTSSIPHLLLDSVPRSDTPTSLLAIPATPKSSCIRKISHGPLPLPLTLLICAPGENAFSSLNPFVVAKTGFVVDRAVEVEARFICIAR
jgi:hypothetical protein